jgi:subtilisin-like proprotein convertase family protein
VIDTATAGEVVSGDYVLGAGGVRAKPIDCPVDPTGATASCNANHTATTVLGGYTYGDLANTNNGTPHNGGEVWAQTLWDVRRAVGRTAALALVTGGMRLSPDNPSMLDMRDAILQQALATRSAVGAPDDHYAALWAIFASRGFGGSATTPTADSTNPTESFDAPHGLRAGAATLRDPYPGGDADGVIEPGEAFAIEQQVTAIGLADLTGTTGTLSTADPATTIIDATAAWPLLGRGRTAANSDPLVARLPAADCTTRTTLTIAVTSSDGNTSASTIVDPRPASTTVVPILDNATASATFVAAGSGAITDVDVRIDELRHPFLGELTIALEHDGVTRTVFDPSNGFSGDDVVDAIIDDEAASAMPNAGPGPVTGRVRPSIASALSGFDGHPVAGAWTLRITDSATGNAGTLRRWGVQGPQVACPRAEIPQAQTGAASGVSTATARLTGTVTPNGRETGRRFAYGTTTAYGSTTPVQPAGAGDAAAAGEAPISGLAPATTYHFRVEAIRENGVVAVAGGDATFTTPPVATPPPPPPPRDITAPRFLGTLTAKPGSRVRGKRRVAFGFRLSEAATVRAVMTRRARGGRSKGRCVAPRAGRRRCTRQLAAGSASRRFTPAGSRRLRFTPGKRLGKGVYTAKLTATDAAGNRSRTRTVRFTVR